MSMDHIRVLGWVAGKMQARRRRAIDRHLNECNGYRCHLVWCQIGSLAKTSPTGSTFCTIENSQLHWKETRMLPAIDFLTGFWRKVIIWSEVLRGLWPVMVVMVMAVMVMIVMAMVVMVMVIMVMVIMKWHRNRIRI